MQAISKAKSGGVAKKLEAKSCLEGNGGGMDVEMSDATVQSSGCPNMTQTVIDANLCTDGYLNTKHLSYYIC